ncbi:MAG TPA: ABC transporter permease [Streptosporangiaceae bacterium]|nr:ABC transporter permease [Streptosporangiaceae bacterium]
MIWLTWRQFRAQSIVTAAALAVLAVVLLITGLQLAHLYDASGLATCHAHGDCETLTSRFTDELGSGAAYKPLFFVGLAVLYLTPALIGLFWGAPLITRELETGTFRLAWNQSVTRTRWMAVKLGLIGLAAMAATGLFSLMITWWAGPIDRVTTSGHGGQGTTSFTRLDPLVFDARGITPIGYAAFAFALGVTAGVLIRRTLPAMAATLAAFAAVQIAWPNWIRPHLITPVRAILPLNAGNLSGLMITNNSTMTVIGAVTKPGAWILSNQTVGTTGHLFTGPVPHVCLSGSFQACTQALGGLHLRQLLTYQPASRFWAFQWYETAIFLAIAVALAGLCFWRIRRRRLF